MAQLDPLLPFHVGPSHEREALESDLWLKASVAPWRTTADRPLRKRISDRLPPGRTMLLQGRRAQLLVGCARPPRRPILCRRHSERGFEQSAKMGGIIVTPPIGNLGYGGRGIRSVQFGSATQETSPPHPPRYSHALFAEQRIKISNRDAIIFSNLLRR